MRFTKSPGKPFPYLPFTALPASFPLVLWIMVDMYQYVTRVSRHDTCFFKHQGKILDFREKLEESAEGERTSIADCRQSPPVCRLFADFVLPFGYSNRLGKCCSVPYCLHFPNGRGQHTMGRCSSDGKERRLGQARYMTPERNGSIGITSGCRNQAPDRAGKPAVQCDGSHHVLPSRDTILRRSNNTLNQDFNRPRNTFREIGRNPSIPFSTRDFSPPYPGTTISILMARLQIHQ